MCVSTSRFADIYAQIKQMSNFQPLEVVGRGSETQLQVGENLNKITLYALGKYYAYLYII